MNFAMNINNGPETDPAALPRRGFLTSASAA